VSQETFTADQFFAKLEEIGEPIVRLNIAAGIYNQTRLQLAQEWVARRDRARMEASQAEEMTIARSANEAAWAAARAAQSAKTRATAALVIATISIIATVVIAHLDL
jgi:hypothetical protein